MAITVWRCFAKSESPVKNGGKHPIIYRVSTCFNHPLGDAGFRCSILAVLPSRFQQVPRVGFQKHPSTDRTQYHTSIGTVMAIYQL